MFGTPPSIGTPVYFLRPRIDGTIRSSFGVAQYFLYPSSAASTTQHAPDVDLVSDCMIFGPSPPSSIFEQVLFSLGLVGSLFWFFLRRRRPLVLLMNSSNEHTRPWTFSPLLLC